MGRKTFISYKYSESRNLRDRIIDSLGDDARFYNGENGYSDDLSSLSAYTIKEYLKNMIYNTSVTIVVLSPNMKKSKWIEWEIEYSLKETTRNDRTSKTNGIVCVVKRDLYLGYRWMQDIYGRWDLSKTFPIIRENQYNLKNDVYTYSGYSKNYIDIVSEDDFLMNPSKYIEDAYKKSQATNIYKIVKIPA